MPVNPLDLAADIIEEIEDATGNDQVAAAQTVWLAVSTAMAPYFSDSGGAAVNEVTAGSSMVDISPTTGNVVVDVVPSNFTGIPESAVTGLVSDLASFAASLSDKVNDTRLIATSAPLTGGGNLTGDLSLGLSLQTDGVTITGAGTSGDKLRIIGSSTGAIVGGGIWARPMTAHALDDEFDTGTLLNAAWAVSSGSLDAVNAISPYASFASGGTRYSHNSQRLDWLMLQPDASGTETTITKDVSSLPTDFAVWIHGCFSHRSGSAGNNDFTFGLTLGVDPWDDNNRVTIYLNESDPGAIQLEFLKKIGGTVTSVGTSLNIGPNDHTVFEGVLIQKVGTTFHGWAITNNGSCLYMGNTTASITIARAGFFATNTSSSSPGNMRMGVDFIRFVNSSTFLP